MNYKIMNDTGVFKVVETATAQTIRSFTQQSEAKKFLRHLNFGGGFDGWSPSFLFRDVSTCINTSRKVKQESV